jgi:hypothetical protein
MILAAACRLSAGKTLERAERENKRRAVQDVQGPALGALLAELLLEPVTYKQTWLIPGTNNNKLNINYYYYYYY